MPIRWKRFCVGWGVVGWLFQTSPKPQLLFEIELHHYLNFLGFVLKGDILKTSGIDTIYPEGIAVAEVLEITNNPKLPFAKIICKPLSAIRNHSHLLVVMPINKIVNNIAPKNDQKK